MSLSGRVCCGLSRNKEKQENFKIALKLYSEAIHESEKYRVLLELKGKSKDAPELCTLVGSLHGNRAAVAMNSEFGKLEVFFMC